MVHYIDGGRTADTAVDVNVHMKPVPVKNACICELLVPRPTSVPLSLCPSKSDIPASNEVLCNFEFQKRLLFPIPLQGLCNI